MLQALLQTIANLGFDAQAVNTSFNSILDTIKTGDTGSLDGIIGIFKGVLSVVTGMDAAELSLIASSLATSVLGMLSDAGASSVLTTITGA
ncbi:MAG: hypothetical protein IJR51_10235 [Clostridia bacterium]|nr:hypothetical protein [Clostridia bacterium]